MGTKKGSRRDKQLKKQLKVDTKEGLIKLYRQIVDKMGSGQYLRDEEIRFLKRFDELIMVAESRVEESKEEDVILSGNLKQFIEQHWYLTELIFGKDTKQKLTEDVYNRIIKEMGYRRCEICNEIHPSESKCLFEEYARLIKEGGETEND